MNAYEQATTDIVRTHGLNFTLQTRFDIEPRYLDLILAHTTIRVERT